MAQTTQEKSAFRNLAMNKIALKFSELMPEFKEFAEKKWSGEITWRKWETFLKKKFGLSDVPGEVERNNAMDLIAEKLAMLDFSKDDRQQFAQLIGYSLSGYGELSYVDDEAYTAAEIMAEQGISEDAAKIQYLEGELIALRSALRNPMARLFGVHPDDLGE